MEKYIPSPLNTEGIVLSEELLELTEFMARNVHEVWAATRMAQGWVYGKERNYTLKEHPCLVPYEELPESEKKYDRDTAIETLKLIKSLNYEIHKV